MNEKKFDCYSCEYRGQVPGSAHSCCNHPEVKKAGISDNVFGAIGDVLSGKAKGAAEALKIEGNLQGIRRGWFVWPADFDPTWLLNCNGYKKKE
jgi:hypothetical protein